MFSHGLLGIGPARGIARPTLFRRKDAWRSGCAFVSHDQTTSDLASCSTFGFNYSLKCRRERRCPDKIIARDAGQDQGAAL